jgi:hypothetical protein
MGNALLSFRGLTIPDPVAAELPFDWSKADGTFNRIYCNDIEIANPSGPGQIPALEITEYNNSPTDFSVLLIDANPGGPFEIKTSSQPSSVSRNLDITATDQLIMSAGGLIQLETFTPAPIIFGINGTLVWQIDPNGNILPMEQNTLQIGNNTDSIILVVAATNIITENIFNIGGGNMNIGNNTGEIFWAFVNDGSFAPDGGNPNPDIGRSDHPIRNLWMDGTLDLAGSTVTADGVQVALTGLDNRGGSGTGPININPGGWVHMTAGGADFYVPFWT